MELPHVTHASQLPSSSSPSWCRQYCGVIIGVVIASLTTACTVQSIRCVWTTVTISPDSGGSQPIDEQWMSLYEIITLDTNTNTEQLYIIHDVHTQQNALFVMISLILNGLWLAMIVPYTLHRLCRPSVTHHDTNTKPHAAIGCIGVMGTVITVILAVALARVRAFDALADDTPIGLICGMCVYGMACMTTIISCVTTCPLFSMSSSPSLQQRRLRHLRAREAALNHPTAAPVVTSLPVVDDALEPGAAPYTALNSS